jgi:phage-related protein (TIGR01555 family)
MSNSPSLVTRIRDGMANLVSSVGTGKDKASQWSYTYTPIPLDQLEAAYATDWLARKIVNIPPKDMTREWRTWQADQAEDLYKTEEQFKVRTKVRKALTWARLYGGSAILIGDGSKELREPLDVTKIAQGGLTYLHVFSCFHLAVEDDDWIRDIADPDYGKPLYYRVVGITGGGGTSFTSNMDDITIHRSRFVFFEGEEAPYAIGLTNTEGWGLSIFESIIQEITHVNSSAANAAALMEEAKVDVIKVPDLHKYFADKESERRLTARFAYANTLKSTINTLLLGGGEEFDRKQTTFAGITDIIHANLEIASGAADIPLTRLLGQSPAGMNSTGESDTRNYYDMLRSHQNTDLRESLTRLDDALIQHTFGTRPDGIAYEWAPLWQMSPDEASKVDLANAQTSQIYINSGVFTNEELRASISDKITETGFWPSLDQHMQDTAELDLTALLAPTPDPTALPAPPPGGPVPPTPGKPTLKVVGGDRKGAGKSKRPFDLRDFDPNQQRAPDGRFGMTPGDHHKATVSLLNTHIRPVSVDQVIAAVPRAKSAIEKVNDKLAQSTPTTSPVSEGGHIKEDGTYTDERKALHEKIVWTILSDSAVKKATPPEGEKPTLTVLGGRGGSGKSWLISSDGPAKQNSIVINPDEIQEHLPGYEGWNAASYHEEAAHIASLIDQTAMVLGVNVTQDATLRVSHWAEIQIKEYSAKGYQVEGHYMFAPPHVSAVRGLKRFVDGGKSGRYVPVEYLIGSTTNEASFDHLKPLMDYWTVFDNSGTAPKLYAYGGK